MKTTIKATCCLLLVLNIGGCKLLGQSSQLPEGFDAYFGDYFEGVYTVQVKDVFTINSSDDLAVGDIVIINAKLGGATVKILPNASTSVLSTLAGQPIHMTLEVNKEVFQVVDANRTVRDPNHSHGTTNTGTGTNPPAPDSGVTLPIASAPPPNGHQIALCSEDITIQGETEPHVLKVELLKANNHIVLEIAPKSTHPCKNPPQNHGYAHAWP